MAPCTRRREARSPRLAKVIRRSAYGRSRFALVTVVVMRLCSKSDAARFASIRRSWAGPPPRRGPLVGVGIMYSPQMMPQTLRASVRRNSCSLEFVLGVTGFVLFDGCGTRGQVEPWRGILQGQTQFHQLGLDLVDGLGTEVADVHQVGLGAGHELTHGVDALALEAVVGAHGELQVLDRQGHVGCQGGIRRARADLDALGGGVQLAGQAEQLDQGGSGRGDGVARGDGILGLDVDDQAVEVGTLLNTGRLNLEGDLQHRRVDRVHRNAADLRVAGLVLRGGDVAAAALDGQFELELSLLVQRGDVQVRVVELHAGRRRDVRGGDDAGPLLAQVGDHGLVMLGGDGQVLDVQDDLGDIFLDTGNRGELVQHTVDPDAGYGSTGDRGQQRAAERVAEGVTEARLQRFDDEPGAVIGHYFFSKSGALCNKHLVFLSASIRYMTQHDWWKGTAGRPSRHANAAAWARQWPFSRRKDPPANWGKSVRRPKVACGPTRRGGASGDGNRCGRWG